MRRNGSSSHLIAPAVLLTGLLLQLNGEAATLEIHTVDTDGRPLPCRMLVRPESKPCLVPGEAVELKVGPDRWFMSSGLSSLEVPAGRAQLRVERGLEYTRSKRTIQASREKAVQRVVLERWIDMKRRGYRCGENHLHVASKPLVPMLAAEGLDFGTSLQWWNTPRYPVAPGQGHVRRLAFAGREIPASVYDAEVEHPWGAVYIVNLPAPLTLAGDPARPNLEFVEHASESGALVCYQGGWSREVAVDALLGFVDVVNVCNNNFHMHRFQPRSRYSNLLNVPGFPVYPDTPEGMMRMNTDTYYRLLNWGLRLAAGAGSATGAKEVPVGYNRAYVRCGADASIEAFYRAWAAGRNFVTNGPMLFLETADGHRPGDTVDLPTGGKRLRVKISAVADQPLTSLELVFNGTVTSFPIPPDPQAEAPKISKRMDVETDVEITRGAWIAARCTVRDDWLNDEELAAYTNDRVRLPQLPSRLRFAHTSPIYITVDGKGAAVRESIEEGLRMLDAFDRFARKQAGPKYRQTILDATAQAREKLRRKLEPSQ